MKILKYILNLLFYPWFIIIGICLLIMLSPIAFLQWVLDDVGLNHTKKQIKEYVWEIFLFPITRYKEIFKGEK